MRKILKEIVIILTLAVITALITNQFSPARIPIIGQWDESKGVVRANPNSQLAQLGLEIDNVKIAKEYFDAGKAVFVDARTTEDFKQGHVPGAVCLPFGEFDQKIDQFLNQIPLEQSLILYCAGRTCEDSHIVAENLMAFGYEKVSVMIDGFPGWKKEGYPIEQSN
ncbi:MAG: rhodanese-like domain-containing protein [Desulfobacteraceae bacterium]|jgi:rhodanese-related sulfurtransferase